jgi:cell division topological specificity factor
MNIFSYFRPSHSRSSAAVAKERLQIIVAHERNRRTGKALDYLPLLQQELLEVVRRYVNIQDEHIRIHIEKDGDFEVLELNIALPEAEVKQEER